MCESARESVNQPTKMATKVMIDDEAKATTT